MSADSRRVATDELPDLDSLAAELVHLKHRQRDLLRLHDKLTEQLMAFPNEFRRAQATRVADEIEAIDDRRAWLEAQILPLRRHREP